MSSVRLSRFKQLNVEFVGRGIQFPLRPGDRIVIYAWDATPLRTFDAEWLIELARLHLQALDEAADRVAEMELARLAEARAEIFTKAIEERPVLRALKAAPSHAVKTALREQRRNKGGRPRA